MLSLPLGIFEHCEEQYVVCHSVQLPCIDLDSFAEKPVRLVKVDRRIIRAKYLKLYSLQSLPECSIQGRLEQSLPNPLVTEAGFHSHTQPADMRHPFKGCRSDVDQPTTASSASATKWTPFAAVTNVMNDSVASSENPAVAAR